MAHRFASTHFQDTTIPTTARALITRAWLAHIPQEARPLARVVWLGTTHCQEGPAPVSHVWLGHARAWVLRRATRAARRGTGCRVQACALYVRRVPTQAAAPLHAWQHPQAMRHPCYHTCLTSNYQDITSQWRVRRHIRCHVPPALSR